MPGGTTVAVPSSSTCTGLRLRVKDADFEYRQLTVRDGKGAKDRVTMLPTAVVEPLKRQLGHARELHERDLASGHSDVSTTMVYTHVLNKGGRGVAGPLDALAS